MGTHSAPPANGVREPGFTAGSAAAAAPGRRQARRPGPCHDSDGAADSERGSAYMRPGDSAASTNGRVRSTARARCYGNRRPRQPH
eukprot:748838-Hanusia_phi.AAC.13